MFDISFGKLLLISVVALIVLGPERLPAVARMLGTLVARAQRFVASVNADIRQQAHLEGFDKLRQDIQETASAFHAQLASEIHHLENAGVTEFKSGPGVSAEVAIEKVSSVDGYAEDHILSQTEDGEQNNIENVVYDENQLDLFEERLPSYQVARHSNHPPQ